ncbi:hypothetical protein M514_05218 [Trichuris suis]|uniref:Uncharacterized protein n=1 Tax=Trichuris suis TaxID=68888 RepID=A0A085M9Q5_9BILA|nr:hypothetical protein M513_05218 [Trichuris suis]KFD67335.1 hypothetical protein M514_05218 [Trichuris suis]
MVRRTNGAVRSCARPTLVPATLSHDQERVIYHKMYVFNGSALYQGVSLNQLLEIGGLSLQVDLVSVLLRFRRFRYGIHGDTEKMFLQIALHEEGRDAGAGTEPAVFQLTRLCLGLSCSPFLAIAMTQQHSQRNSEKYSQVATEVLENMYVDDLVRSCSSKEEKCELPVRQHCSTFLDKRGLV